MDASAPARHALVDALLAQGVLRSGPVERALREVPRHLFLPVDDDAHAYVDAALSIGEGQTISAPHMVATMAEALEPRPGHRVLEVGGGSGYHAAVLGRLVTPGGRVLTLERHERLAREARAALERLDPPPPVEVRVGDGSLGAPDAAPFDRISVAAGAPDVPPPLVEQLAPEGRLVVPVGPAHGQHLMLVHKDERGLVVNRSLGPVQFVPLVGEHGW